MQTESSSTLRGNAAENEDGRKAKLADAVLTFGSDETGERDPDQLTSHLQAVECSDGGNDERITMPSKWISEASAPDAMSLFMLYITISYGFYPNGCNFLCSIPRATLPPSGRQG